MFLCEFVGGSEGNSGINSDGGEKGEGKGKRAERREGLKGKTLPYLITQSSTAT